MNTLIRQIPVDLWKGIKHLAVDLGLSANKTVIQAMKELVERKGEK